MSTKKPTRSIKAAMNTALTARLRHTFTPAQITDWSDMLAQLSDNGLKIDDVMTNGTPTPDTLTVKTFVPVNSLDAIIAKMQHHQHIRKIEIFPNGIPIQENWRVHVGVGFK
jgi:hypothetical protein